MNKTITTSTIFVKHSINQYLVNFNEKQNYNILSFSLENNQITMFI